MGFAGRPEPGSQHARGLAWRVGQRDGPRAGSGRLRRAACERHRARAVVRDRRCAFGPAGPQGTLGGDVERCRAAAPLRRSRLRRAVRSGLGYLAPRPGRAGGGRHVDLVSCRTPGVLRRGRAGGICRARAAADRCRLKPAHGWTTPARRFAGCRRARPGLCRVQADAWAMRRESIAWERAAAVRDAADGWRRAGAIGAPTLEAIKNAYPDPCITPSAVWCVLTAVMVTAIVLCSFGAFALAIRPREVGLSLLLWLFGAACVVATERLEVSPRLARRGAAGAAAFWGILLFLGGLGLLLHEILAIPGEDALRLLLLTSALTWAAACWRWGSPLFAGLSAASFFVLLAQVRFGR